jgi:hypothetical protein
LISKLIKRKASSELCSDCGAAKRVSLSLVRFFLFHRKKEKEMNVKKDFFNKRRRGTILSFLFFFFIFDCFMLGLQTLP